MPSSIHATPQEDGSVQLTWSFAGDPATFADVTRFEIFCQLKDSSDSTDRNHLRYTLQIGDSQLQKGIRNIIFLRIKDAVISSVLE